MRVELGGGWSAKSRGEGFINVDLLDCADVVHDLSTFPYPFEDDSVDEIYSSHCLEHLTEVMGVLYELTRICKVGAKVEIRVPHFGSELAMVRDHVSVFSMQAVRNFDIHFIQENWKGCKKRLTLTSHNFGSSEGLEKAKKELPFLRGLSDEVIMQWIQGTCHEICFHFTVIENETYENDNN